MSGSVSELHKEFTRDVAALARKYGVVDLQLGFRFADQPPTHMLWSTTSTSFTVTATRPDASTNRRRSTAR